MGPIPLLLLGGVALLVMSKKKTTPVAAEAEPEPEAMPPRPDEGEDEGEDEEMDYGDDAGRPQMPGDEVARGMRRDRLGPHPWKILVGDDGDFMTADYPIGHQGAKDEIGRAATVTDAKKQISDFYNARLIEADYPTYVKDDPWFRPGRRTPTTLAYRS